MKRSVTTSHHLAKLGKRSKSWTSTILTSKSGIPGKLTRGGGGDALPQSRKKFTEGRDSQ